MTKLKLGMIGWRGMVGSVLVERMTTEKDFDLVDAVFFSTSQVGEKAPEFSSVETLKDASILSSSPQWMSSSHAKEEIIPMRFTRSSEVRDGMEFGLTPLRP